MPHSNDHSAYTALKTPKKTSVRLTVGGGGRASKCVHQISACVVVHPGAVIDRDGRKRPRRRAPFNQFFGFGDSSIDSGFYRALSSPGGGANFNALWLSAVAHGAGKPTTSPGLMNSEALAALFGLTAIPANQPGGTNYATSGAKNETVNSDATGGFRAATPTVTQIANYLAANGGPADSRFGRYRLAHVQRASCQLHPAWPARWRSRLDRGGSHRVAH